MRNYDKVSGRRSGILVGNIFIKMTMLPDTRSTLIVNIDIF